MVWGGGVRPGGNLTSWPRQHHQLALHRLGTPPRRRAGKGLAPLSDHPRALPDPRLPAPRARDREPETTMPELRRDPLSGAVVILATDRSHRPGDHGDPSGSGVQAPHRSTIPDHDPSCPFCPGNEHRTPPESARRGDGAPGEPGWSIRVFPNLFPITGPDQGATEKEPADSPTPASGTHEVVVVSPLHSRSLGGLNHAQLVAVLATLRDRPLAHRLRRGTEARRALRADDRPEAIRRDGPYQNLLKPHQHPLVIERARRRGRSAPKGSGRALRDRQRCAPRRSTCRRCRNTRGAATTRSRGRCGPCRRATGCR